MFPDTHTAAYVESPQLFSTIACFDYILSIAQRRRSVAIAQWHADRVATGWENRLYASALDIDCRCPTHLHVQRALLEDDCGVWGPEVRGRACQ